MCFLEVIKKCKAANSGTTWLPQGHNAGVLITQLRLRTTLDAERVGSTLSPACIHIINIVVVITVVMIKKSLIFIMIEEEEEEEKEEKEEEEQK